MTDLATAETIYNELLIKKNDIERRKSSRFADFLQNKELQNGPEEAQAEAFEVLKGAEIDDDHELSETAQLTAAALLDTLKKVVNSYVPDLRVQ